MKKSILPILDVRDEFFDDAHYPVLPLGRKAAETLVDLWWVLVLMPTKCLTRSAVEPIRYGSKMREWGSRSHVWAIFGCTLEMHVCLTRSRADRNDTAVVYLQV